MIFDQFYISATILQSHSFFVPLVYIYIDELFYL